MPRRPHPATSGQRLIWLGAAIGGLLLFAVLVGFVRRIELALREQQQRVVEAVALAIVGELSAARFEPEFELQGKHLVLQVPPDLGTVAADPVVLGQVINSVLANAMEATAQGDRIALAARRQGRRAEVELHDSGAGIAPERLASISKPFYTTKPRGLGLGLPLARGVVRRLGGEIDIDSESRPGTRVRLSLPLAGEIRPDVVLLDHNLPSMNGLQALARLRSLDPQARVVLMTGFGSIDLAVSAMKQGAAGYLAKPLALGELKLLLEAEQQLTDGDAPTVLIQGETGTGKELVARALQFGATRAERPFVELNCGALPQQLVEAELFGYEKGAFTDARQRKVDLVETAEGGTLFLDEIGEADASTQVKLLKLLEDRRYRRLGGLREQQVNVRIVAATHRPLEQMVREGRFRADLYFRLRIVELSVPPLRERAGDVPFLAQHFLSHHARRYRLERLQMRGGGED